MPSLRLLARHAPPRRPAARRYSTTLENIGFVRAYAKPVATIFLWSSLTYMSLQAVWSKLYFDEIRLETEARIDRLHAELKLLDDRP